jgi:hypothetical protein
MGLLADWRTDALIAHVRAHRGGERNLEESAAQPDH